MSGFNLDLEATHTVAEHIPTPHLVAIGRNVLKAIKPDHTDDTMGETLRLVIPAEGRTNVYVAYLTGPAPFPVGAMLTCKGGGEFRMVIGTRAEIEEKITASGADPNAMITQLL